MHRRTLLSAGALALVGTLAGCLGDSDEVFSISPPDDVTSTEVTVDLDAGDYQLLVSFDEYDASGEGIDEPYVSCQLSDGDFTDTIAEVEVTEEGQTRSSTLTVDADGEYVGVLHVPTTTSSATATLSHA